MMDEKVRNLLEQLKAVVVEEVSRSQLIKNRPRSSIVKLFERASSGESMRRPDNIIDLAAKGDKRAKEALKTEILKIITTTKRVSLRDIDRILEGYYINYYGTSKDITSDYTVSLINDILRQVLIDKHSDADTKRLKLAQLLYQECYGYGIVDEFTSLKPDAKLNKVEELAASGGRCISLKISGLNFKLDKVDYPDEEVIKITDRLCKNSPIALTRANNKVETELLDQTRVTLHCPPLMRFHSFNIRLHYDGKELTRRKLIELGTSTEELESFLDLIMKFRPRFLVIGGQATGKSTDLNRIASRYDRNMVVTTAETSFELGLDKQEHLIVPQLKLGLMDVEKFQESLFRLNADVLLLGEARTSEDVMLLTQMAKRQSGGTGCTWHNSTKEEAMFDMASALVRGNYFHSHEDAMAELTRSVELVFVKRVLGKDSQFPGRRVYHEIAEVKKFHGDSKDGVEFNLLFKYNYDTNKLERVNNVSADLAKTLLDRIPNKGAMEVLREGRYDLLSDGGVGDDKDN